MNWGKCKRIAIDAHALGDHSGGNESYYFNLINHLRCKDSIKLYVLVREDYDVNSIKTDCEIIRFRSKNAFVRNFIEIPGIVKEYRIDVLHMQYFIPFKVSSKVIVTIHDISFEHYKDIFTKKDYILQKLLIPYAAKHADAIFTVSEYSKEDIVEHYHVSKDKVFVTYNGAADVFDRLDADDNRKKEVLDKYQIDRPYILSVGNLQPRKNIKRLISAYKQLLNDTQSDVNLVMVGKKAWMYDDLFKEFSDSTICNQVILTDYVEVSDLVILYQNALFFIYPSYFEGFGIPVLEAMYSGTPTATSNCTSLPEVIGDAGLLFNPYDVQEICDKMKLLLQSNELRGDLVQKGYKRAKMFTWEKTAELAMQVYQEL